MGDVGVGDDGGVLDAIGEVAEAGAEDDAEGGPEGGLVADVAGGELCLLEYVSHDRSI